MIKVCTLMNYLSHMQILIARFILIYFQLKNNYIYIIYFVISFCAKIHIILSKLQKIEYLHKNWILNF